jgi:Na+/melibiose symporter-like transporter
MVSFGLTPLQHVVMITLIFCLRDLFGTASNVATSKVFARISPLSRERSRVITAQNLGQTIYRMLQGLPLLFMGIAGDDNELRYRILLLGAIIFTLPAIGAGLLPSFAKQRVLPTLQGNDTRGGVIREMLEGFAIVKHNKWFVLTNIAGFITVFTPGVDEQYFYRFGGLPTVKFGKKTIQGESLQWFRSNFIAIPGILLQPFAPRIIEKVGGPRNLMVLSSSVTIFLDIIRFFVGAKTLPGLLFLWFTEAIQWTFGKQCDIAGGMINFEMLDYVEWKTAKRSEGVTMAVSALINKMITGNIGKITGSWFLEYIGFRPSASEQSERYIKWAQILYLLVPGIDEIFHLMARVLYKYPISLRKQVESDLMERHKKTEASNHS